MVVATPGRPGQRGRARPADGRLSRAPPGRRLDRARGGRAARAQRRCCSCSRGPRCGATRTRSQPHLVRARSGNYGAASSSAATTSSTRRALDALPADADLTALAAPISMVAPAAAAARARRGDRDAHGRGGDRARARARAPRERHADLDRPRAVAGARHPVAARDHPAPRLRGHQRRRRLGLHRRGPRRRGRQAHAAVRGLAERLAHRAAGRVHDAGVGDVDRRHVRAVAAIASTSPTSTTSTSPAPATTRGASSTTAASTTSTATRRARCSRCR